MLCDEPLQGLGDVPHQPLAQLFRDAILEHTGLGHRYFSKIDRRRSGHRSQHPDQQRNQQPGDSRRLQAAFSKSYQARALSQTSATSARHLRQQVFQHQGLDHADMEQAEGGALALAPRAGAHVHAP